MKRLKLLVCGIAGVVMLGWAFAQDYVVGEPVVESRPVFDLPLVSPEAVPEVGTFWLYSKSGPDEAWPPLPYDPYGGIIEIYTLPGLPEQYVVADTKQDWEGLQAVQLEMAELESGDGMMTMNSLEFPGEGDTNYSGEGSWPEGSYGMMSYPSNSLWLEITSVSNGLANVIIHGTVPEVWYELLSKEALTNGQWQSESPLWSGAEGQDWTPATVPVLWRTNCLFIWARSWADEDGNGIPDWWEEQFFGSAGVDAYADADGDGWVDIQEYQNGTSPNTFNTPPAPQGVTVSYNSSNSAVQVKWQPASGPVTGYEVQRIIPELGWEDTFTVASNQTIYTETFPVTDPDVRYFSPSYSVQVIYSQGGSTLSPESALYDHQLGVEMALARNADDGLVLQASRITSEVESIRLTRFDYDVPAFEPPVRTVFQIALSNVSGGAYTLPLAWADPEGYNQGAYEWVAQGTASGGRQGEPVPLGYGESEAFKDGREHLRQNLIYQLRAAGTNASLNYAVYDGPTHVDDYVAPTARAVASYQFVYPWDSEPYAFFDPELPFWENYQYRNFAFDTGLLDPSGHLTTGVYWFGEPRLEYPAEFEHVATWSTTPAAMLGASATQWYSGTELIGRLDYLASEGWFGFGQSASGPDQVFSLPSGNVNKFGLAMNSLMLAWGSQSNQRVVVPAGGTVSVPTTNFSPSGSFYIETAQPQLQLVDYFFAQAGWGLDWLPGHDAFNVTNQSPVLFTSVGGSTMIAGYAKYRVANGYTNAFGYLGQYFEKAYKANGGGNRSTNETGVLSPYGQFFTTEPGKTFLTTKPDGVSTNVGECVVHAIKLQLDVNHDGAMETAWNSPDNTTQDKPFVFWVNSDQDKAGVGGNWDKDIPVAVGSTNYDYSAGSIHSQRNMEDFARLWICGVPTLPTGEGYTVTLGWGFIQSGFPRIRLYGSCETNGGIDYLINTNTAATQLSAFGGPLGEITPDNSLSLPLSWFTNRSNRHLLFEAGGVGEAPLILTIMRGTQVVGETSAWLKIHDIRDFYEQAAVTNVIQWWPDMVQTNRISGYKVLSYPKVETGNAKQLAVFVHGWRMTYADYEIFSQSMFKRLYWQGYQGKFAALRWPTRSPATEVLPGLDMGTFNRSEHIAFKSGTGAAAYFDDLRNRYTDYKIGTCGHSMGGVVLMQAMKELAAAELRPLDNVVLMQAAVAAHCFDPSVTNFAPFVNQDLTTPTPDTYPNYGAGITNALRPGGKIFNFYNPSDLALFTWQINQAFYNANFMNSGPATIKPNTFFGYESDGTNCVVRTNDWNQGFLSTLYGGYYPNGPTRNITNVQERMPFVSRPRSLAVGAQPGVGGQIQGGEFNLHEELGFGGVAADHSGEFTRNIQGPLWMFYSQLRTNLFSTP